MGIRCPFVSLLVVLSTAALADSPSEPLVGYVALPGVDPFPNAPSGDGWGVSVGTDDIPIHLILLEASEGESAQIALSRRNAPKPRLPANGRLIFDMEPRPGGARALTSAVVERVPVLAGKDIAACQIGRTPHVTLNLNNGSQQNEERPQLRLRLSDQAVERLNAVAKKAQALQRLYFVVGDEAIGWMYLTYFKGSPLEVDLGPLNESWLKRICPK
jgi:hypothetical protein